MSRNQFKAAWQFDLVARDIKNLVREERSCIYIHRKNSYGNAEEKEGKIFRDKITVFKSLTRVFISLKKSSSSE